MSSTRFLVDPDRIFPDHAYAPGYEPARNAISAEAPPDQLQGGDLTGFVAAAGLVTGALALVSIAMIWF